MKKIIYGFFLILLVAFSQNGYAANKLPSSKMVVYQESDSKINNLKQNYQFIKESVTVTIGWTDACGVCHDYNFTGTWEEIWRTVNLVDMFYELGFCGTIYLIPN